MMILTIDVGNTNIVVAGFKDSPLAEGGSQFFKSRIDTNQARMADQYAIMFVDILRLYDIDRDKITGAVISSVVPPITRHIAVAVKSLTGKEPLIVGPGLKTGLNIKIDNPAELGADLVCGAVAAKTLYKSPCIAIDLGTVTKVMAIDKTGSLIGGVLAPGVGVGFQAMAKSTALLPLVGAGGHSKVPARVIGANTTDCIHNGVLYGTACMLDGLIERFEEEIGERCSVVATGGYSEVIAPYCKRVFEVNGSLVSQGLLIIYNKNTV
jgi:type III pantothenate kinase